MLTQGYYLLSDHKTIVDKIAIVAVIIHTAEVVPNTAIHIVPKIGATALGKLTLVLKKP